METEPSNTSGLSVPTDGEPVHPKSVSRVLRGIRDPEAHENHNLKVYQRAFRSFDRRAIAVLGTGSDAVALRLEDGTVLKITRWRLPEDFGSRPFDLPVLERGFAADDGRAIEYYIQPYAEPATTADYKALVQILRAAGYTFRDAAERNVGVYNGEPKLLDPFAVEKLSD